MTELKEKMISTRVTEENISSMDKVARSQGISRSQWIRRAILAQLVMDLVELKRESEEIPPDPFLEDLAPTHEEHPLVAVDASGHDINCIKSIDHEGGCLD